MFNTLDEQMKRDDASSTTPRERAVKYLAVLIAAALVFGGLYAGIALVE